jgi:hypothetical protein
MMGTTTWKDTVCGSIGLGGTINNDPQIETHTLESGFLVPRPPTTTTPLCTLLCAMKVEIREKEKGLILAWRTAELRTQHNMASVSTRLAWSQLGLDSHLNTRCITIS